VGNVVTDPALVLLTAAALSASAVTSFAWQVSRREAGAPDRLVGELRLAQWTAILLSAIGATSMGLAIAANVGPLGNVDMTAGVGFVMLAGVILQCEPRTALALVIGGFALHALVDIAHRPGWLSTEILPRWYAVGSAAYDVWMAAICYWARRR
jgi:hypothetical protein